MNPPPAAAVSDTPYPAKKGCGGCGRSLLVALVIFGAILGASLWSVGRTFEATKRTEDRVMTTTLAYAIEQYLDEKGDLPHAGAPEAGPRISTTDEDTDTSLGSGIVRRLMGKEERGGTDLLDGFKQARVDQKTVSGWKNGLIAEDESGVAGVVDPWGWPYRIRLDTDGDGKLRNPYPEQVHGPGANVGKRVIVWSAGRDGDWSTWDDNAISWYGRG